VGNSGMRDAFTMALAEIQPSQLYISSEKLARLMEEIDAGGLGFLEPLPVKELDGRVILTDGHTRALAAHLHGCSEVKVYWDRDELDWEAYGICVKWCLEEGIHSVADLESHIVDPDKYEILWYGRCRKMQSDLAKKREGLD
jgi:hypothetical protein